MNLILSSLGSLLLVAAGSSQGAQNSRTPSEEDVVMCSLEVMICPDGETTVARDPENNCQFKACPGEEAPPRQAPTTTRRIIDRIGPGEPVDSSTTRGGSPSER